MRWQWPSGHEQSVPHYHPALSAQTTTGVPGTPTTQEEPLPGQRSEAP